MYRLAIAYSRITIQDLILEKAYYTIGRHGNCDISIPNRYISKIHCTLVIAEEDARVYCLIIDGSLVSGERSSNGTWVNGVFVSKAKLNHQDVIGFGKEEFPKLIFYSEFSEELGDTISHEKPSSEQLN